MIISKKPPYENTTVDPDKTKADIDRLLRGYGVSAIQWTTDYQNNQVKLAFKVEAEISGVKKIIGLQLEPPTFAKKRRSYNPRTGKNEEVYAPNWAQSMRLLYYWLKAKLEAVAYGFTSVEKEFLSQVIVSLPNGQTRTVGELITDPERLSKLALEEKAQTAEPAWKVEDAEVMEVEDSALDETISTREP
jgi:hypothetical protein